MAQINRIGVIGAGNMGSGIAQKIAQEGIDVTLVDIEESFVDRGLGSIRTLLVQGIERGLFTQEKVDAVMSRITGTTDLSALKDADIVIEAVFEDKSVKTELFQKLDAVCGQKTIFATNTSSFYVKDFADVTSRPDRFIGLHYFYHPAKNRLLEIIPADKTAPETVETCMLAAKLHSKTPIVVKDAPGFAVNRFFVPFLNEAARLFEQGIADIPTIEEGAKQAFRIGMGPFQLMNVTGIPIAVHAATTLGKELGPFYAPCRTLVQQMEKKEDWDLSGNVDDSKLEAVRERLYGVCFGVAAALVDEGVASMEDTDRGAKIGLRWTKGPFELMNALSVDAAYDMVQKVCTLYQDFTMPALLEKQKQAGRNFEFTLVDLKVKNNIGYITINRPEAMNALNETVVRQLDECLDRARDNAGVEIVVIQGAGKTFVAGADISFFIKKIRKDKIEDIVEFTRKGHEVLLKIENFPKPVFVFLDGLSMGGGSELALAAQAVIATEQGSMAFPETGIGIYPGLGGMLRLAKMAGPELARYYTFTGASLKAKQLKELGIVAAVIDFTDLESEAKKIAAAGLPDKYRKRQIPDSFKAPAALCTPANAKKLLNGEAPAEADPDLAAKTVSKVKGKAPLALKYAEEIIDLQTAAGIEKGVEIELERLADIFSTKDCLEGLTSAGRKKPEFKGE
ncbi:MAG: enoyl-CoA hydratase/isomerase family protein [Desulfarculaceae bacterium]|nr:enoyl-CoA hydratase/isomerase family protein [Desulfarculaceae bacterium]